MDEHKERFLDLVKSRADEEHYKWVINGIKVDVRTINKFDPRLADLYCKFIDLNREIHEYCKGKLER